MNNKLMYLLLCLLLMFVFIGEAILPVYADDGQQHGNPGGIDTQPGGNGPNHNPPDSNHFRGNSPRPSDNFTPPAWGRSDNFTPPAWGRPPSDNMTPGAWGKSDNFTPPAWGRSDNMTPPAWGRSENMTPPAWGRSPSDNITSLSDNITRDQQPWRGSDNNTVSPWSKLSQILNIDEGTLMNALRQVFGPFMK